MSYSNGTTHYNLPQTIGTDKRDWSDTNKAFADLDAAVYSANNDLTAVADRMTALESDNTVNKEDIAKNESNITTIEGRVTAVEHVANDANNGISDVRNDAEDMITAYNEKSAQSLHDYEAGDFFIYNDVLYRATQKISTGNTIIPNTNCEATNVTTAFAKHTIHLVNDSSLFKNLHDAVDNVVNTKGETALANMALIHVDTSKQTKERYTGDYMNTTSGNNTYQFFRVDANYSTVTTLYTVVCNYLGGSINKVVINYDDDSTSTPVKITGGIITAGSADVAGEWYLIY